MIFVCLSWAVPVLYLMTQYSALAVKDIPQISAKGIYINDWKKKKGEKKYIIISGDTERASDKVLDIPDNNSE